MNSYVVLLRGINVGGKNKVPMAALKSFLEEHGCRDVATYIQSGNVVLHSALAAKTLVARIETGLPRHFALDTAVVKVLVLTRAQLGSIVDNRPTGFGDQPATYHSDVLFLMGIDAADAVRDFMPKEGVDRFWLSEPAIYFQRLTARRTETRLTRILATPAYLSMTIRNWRTTTKLRAMLDEIDA